MKILICTWRLTHGGAERVAALWAKGFIDQGYSVDFLVGSRSSKVSYDIPKNVGLYYETPFPDKIAVHFIPEIYKSYRIKRILEKIKPDVVISVLPSYGQKIIRLLNKKIPVIVTEHNSYERPSYAPMPQIQEEQKFNTNGLFDAVTVLTQADKDYLINKMGEYFARNTYVMPNPLAFSPTKGLENKAKVILAAGRMDAWHCKGFDLLINAWGRIAEKHRDWILKIAGGGNPAPILSMAKKNHIDDRISFLGFVDMLECYKDASIFVLSSRYEGFGMVLTEAMSQGCACVACDYKGRQREIIQNENQGIVCPVDDVGALAVAIEKMIDDESYRTKCQKNAIERSKYFALSNIMEKWNDIFRALKLI